MHRPADGAVAAGDLLKEDVLLVVVEVGVIEAGHILGVGRVWDGDLADGLVRADVVLAAGLEADVGERGAARDEDGEHVPEHGGVGLPVLSLRRVAGPRSVEDMGDVGERLEGLRHGDRVGQVQEQMRDGGGGRRGPGRERATGDGVHLPGPAGGVVAREYVDERCADDAGGSDDEGDALEGELGALRLALLDGAHRARPPPASSSRESARLGYYGSLGTEAHV